MKRWLLLLAALICAAPAVARVPDPAALQRIAGIVQDEIAAGHLPGAVVQIGGENGVYYRAAYGEREVRPEHLPMTPDTIFDLASLTKVVATTTAIMQLSERGRLDLDAPVARYWPAFAANGKAPIRVRDLLTHYSGLPADLDLSRPWKGRSAAIERIVAVRPSAPPGERYLYSDINFEVLGELVERVSGEPLARYCQAHVFAPLGMRDSGFLPAPSPRIAPTVRGRQGVVHDPTAWRMGGVAGHAGVFSSADDLARFARMLLAGGSLDGVRVLSRASVEAMTLPQSPAGQARLRGLGWDIAAPFASDRDTLAPVGAYGHTGFTGTSLWIDPVARLYVILLSNRVHPDDGGDAGPLRERVAEAVGAALGPLTDADIATARPALARYAAARQVVSNGLDVLAESGFAPLRGLRVGLITNQTGIDRKGRRNIDLLREAPGVKLVALFSPEHGLYGKLDEKVASGAEPSTGLPVYSLYGETRRPSEAMLAGVDALVFDIQDAGARFYTYGTTLAYAMEAAARKGIPIWVLDRPDPIGGAQVQGPMLDAGRTSFTGYWPIPVRPGMTLGELAGFYNQEAAIHADLHVVAMRGYSRRDWFDDTGLAWVNPSPNLRSLGQTALYPGVGMIEGANISVGRGTDSPFEQVGAPWIDGRQLARYLTTRSIAGASFSAVTFTPDSGPYHGQTCRGVRISVSDRNALDSPALGVELAAALHRLYPDRFRLDETLGGIGSASVVASIRAGADPRAIAAGWQGELDAFQARRARFLLY
ncbi:exo-beta-N-acetylmuramidase NamZ domain-containing protein [Pseudomonas knackmussii]|uniref:exo-beta-N-acetylmuramidase NamZ domain-containing protein n=1 Tax=Pseudomonas knackmussii TaxID=65741 RepID=UPI003BE5642D